MRDAYSLAMEKDGPDSRFTLNAAMELAGLYLDNGQFLKALDVYRPAVRSAQSMLDRGERNWINLIVIAEYGYALAKAGRIDEGLKVIQTTQKARDILDSQPPMDLIVQDRAAKAYALSGADASVLSQIEVLRNLQEKKVGVGWPQRVELFAAQMRGDTQLVRGLVAREKLAEVPPNETPNAALLRLAPLAEGLLGSGDLDGALAAAKHLIETLPKSKEPSFDGDVERRASLVAGKVHVLQKRPTEAIPLLQRALSLAEGSLDTQMSPHHADALIWLGMAHLATGHKPEAKKLADQVKAIHDRHPQLAQVFRKPLADLNARIKTS
jgi:tetratricopeptide (TPR) repeat protein